MIFRKIQTDIIVKYNVAGKTSNNESKMLAGQPIQASAIPKTKRNHARITFHEDNKNFMKRVSGKRYKVKKWNTNKFF